MQFSVFRRVISQTSTLKLPRGSRESVVRGGRDLGVIGVVGGVEL